jgi:hypothetical protein
MEVSGQLHAPVHLPPGKIPWYPLDRRLVAPQSRLDAVVKRKIPSPLRESNPRTSIVQPAAQRYTDWSITALYTLDLQQIRRTNPLCYITKPNSEDFQIDLNPFSQICSSCSKLVNDIHKDLQLSLQTFLDVFHIKKPERKIFHLSQYHICAVY